MMEAVIKNVALELDSDPAIFSPNAVDAGTLAMLSVTDFLPEDKVLDLGCGCGVVGILAAKLLGEERVVLCDISGVAVKAAAENAGRNGVGGVSVRQSDAYENIPERDFTLTLSNPPYHTDFSVAKEFIEGGYKRLVTGGRMIMVTKRLTWYKNKLTAVFGGVKVSEIEGYYVFTAEKRGYSGRKKEEPPRPQLSKKLQRKYGRKGEKRKT